MRTHHLAALFVSFLLAPATAGAATFLNPCAHNGIELRSYLELGYTGSGGTVGTFPPGAPPAGGFSGDDLMRSVPQASKLIVWNMGIASASATIGPASVGPAISGASGKDHVDAGVVSHFEFGQPTPGSTQPSDTFTLRAHGMASAVDARIDTTGAPADALVRATAGAIFFNDLVPASGPATTCDGFFKLPGMSVNAYEVLKQIQVFEDTGAGPVLVANQVAPSPAEFVPLTPGASYELRFDYVYQVPYGVDPPFDASVEIAVVSVEEVPMTGPLAATGLGSLIVFVGLLGVRGVRCWAQVASR